MELSSEEQFVLSYLSSSDDSDEERFFDSRRQQMVVVVLAVKEFEDRYARRRQGSKVGRLCIPRNRFYGNELLMWDYFADIPTYLAHIWMVRQRSLCWEFFFA